MGDIEMRLNKEELLEMVRCLTDSSYKKNINNECMETVHSIAFKVKNMVEQAVDGKDNEFIRQHLIFERLSECLLFVMAGLMHRKGAPSDVVFSRLEYVNDEVKKDYKRYKEEYK